MNDSRRSPKARGSSVQQDWLAWLPQEKTNVFLKQERALESLYNMFSVSLNEALECRHACLFANSFKALRVAAELCELLAAPLAGTLRGLHLHSKHYGTTPSAAPLDPENFAGPRGQRSARLSGLLSRVLLSQRMQFLHKVSTVEEMVEDLDKDFRVAASDLADAASPHPEQLWEEVVWDHYDLNTCLRETFVLLKSFLVALPPSEVEAFQRTVEEQSRPARERHVITVLAPARSRVLSAVAGK